MRGDNFAPYGLLLDHLARGQSWTHEQMARPDVRAAEVLEKLRQIDERIRKEWASSLRRSPGESLGQVLEGSRDMEIVMWLQEPTRTGKGFSKGTGERKRRSKTRSPTKRRRPATPTGSKPEGPGKGAGKRARTEEAADAALALKLQQEERELAASAPAASPAVENAQGRLCPICLDPAGDGEGEGELGEGHCCNVVCGRMRGSGVVSCNVAPDTRAAALARCPAAPPPAPIPPPLPSTGACWSWGTIGLCRKVQGRL